MIYTDIDRKSQFIEWVSVHAPEHKVTWLEANLQRVESFCKRRNYFATSLFEQQDEKLLLKIHQDMCQDKIFRLSCDKIYKYVLFDFKLYCTYCHELKDVSGSVRKLKDNEFSLETVPELSFTKPVTLTFAEEQPVTVKSWAELYCIALQKLGVDRFTQLKDSLGSSDFSDNGNRMRNPREVYPGVFAETGFSANDLLKRLKRFFERSEVKVDCLTIEYRKLSATVSPVQGITQIPEAVRNAIKSIYASGIRFDNTVLSILGNQCGISITESMCNALRQEMFKRSDGLYFLPELIANKDAIQSIKHMVLSDLNTYYLCEVSKLYEIACAESSVGCIRNTDDYADFLEFLLPDSIRITSAFASRIVRPVGVTTNEVMMKLAEKIFATITENGCMTEDDLLLAYPIVSANFLKKLLEKSTDKVITTIINDLLCYQTIEALGFDESFSELLNSILEKIEALELPPTIDILHTLLSVEANQNFRNAYGIPDDKAFRRIITMYYHGQKPRDWKAGCFMEVKKGDV